MTYILVFGHTKFAICNDFDRWHCSLVIIPDTFSCFRSLSPPQPYVMKKNKQYLLKIGPPEHKIGKYHSSSTQPQPKMGGFKMGQVFLDFENSRKLADSRESLNRASRWIARLSYARSAQSHDYHKKRNVGGLEKDPMNHLLKTQP